MSNVIKRTFSLTEEQAAFIDQKVKSGKFASGSEVVRAGIRSMQEDDEIFERWVREEVLPVAERVARGEEKLLSPAEVSRSLRKEFERLAKAAE